MDGRTPKHKIPVVILCGGQGTRLREETEYRPKPMVEIGGKPILWHIMKIYGHHGLKKFILCLGYKGWSIKQYFLRSHERMRDFTVSMKHTDPPVFHNQEGEEDWLVTCAETGPETGTGGRLARVQQYIDSDTILFTYGDAVANVDVDALLDFHFEQGRMVTVTGVHPTSRYGEMKVDGGKVTEFNEKPTVPEGFVSGGFFAMQREFFDYLEDDPGHMLELGPLSRLAREGQLSIYHHDGYWQCMDTYRDYLLLNEEWKESPAWRLWR